MMRVVITGGGTGGHLYPALAVAEALQHDSDVSALLYIGNHGRKEATLVPQYGIRFEGLAFSGMPRGARLGILPWSWQLARAFGRARCLLKAFRPDVVFATGGYVTAPVLLAAMALGVPYVLHEPDAYPGLVNRVMARWAAQMTCAFGKARERLTTRQLHVTGNPLRSRIGQVPREEALGRLDLPFSLEKPVLLVTGGSQGARRLNDALISALPALIETLGFQILHQTGDALFDEVNAQCPPAYREHPAYVPSAFIGDMASALALADVAVCRSGSMTLSEMYRGGIPTILAPYPYAAADHQRMNALASQEAGASVMVEDAAFTGDALTALLSELMREPTRLTAMRAAATRLAHPDATRDVVGILKNVVQHT